MDYLPHQGTVVAVLKELQTPDNYLLNYLSSYFEIPSCGLAFAQLVLHSLLSSCGQLPIFFLSRQLELI